MIKEQEKEIDYLKNIIKDLKYITKRNCLFELLPAETQNYLNNLETSIDISDSFCVVDNYLNK